MNAPMQNQNLLTEPKDFMWKDNRRMNGLIGDMRRRIFWKKYPSIRRTASALWIASALALALLTARHYTDDWQKIISLTALDCKWKERLPPAVIVELEKVIGQKVTSICSQKRFWIWKDNFVTWADWSVHLASNMDIPSSITVEKQ